MELLSPSHLFWLALTVLFVMGCFHMRRLALESRWHRRFRAALFIVVAANEIAWFSYRHVDGAIQ